MTFHQRNEAVRINHAQFGMADPAKRFHAKSGLAGTERNLRLIVNDHMTVGDCLGQDIAIQLGLAILGLEQVRELASGEIGTRQQDSIHRLGLEHEQRREAFS